MTATTPALDELDRRYVFHPFTAPGAHERDGGPAMIVSGKGSTLTAADGRTYLDAMAGLWCVNVGYGRPELAETLREQALKLPYYHGFSHMATDTPALLAERIIGLTGDLGMQKVFFGSSGSDANDTQMKLVWHYNNLLGRPEKKKIIARHRGYHGVTIASASLTGLPAMHAQFDLPLPQVRHVTPPYSLWEREPGEDDAAFVARLAADLEARIVAEGPETVAAFIAEPVQAAGGVLPPPDGYFPAIQAVLRRYDVLLIADEVVSGFGRLGGWFGSHVLGIEPDLMTIAKGVTSAYVPLSGVLVGSKVWETLADDGGAFQHGYTYSAHPLAAAAALTNLDIVENEQLVEQVARRGERLRSELNAAFADHELVGEVRGIGLVAALEFVAERGERPVRFDPALTVGARITRACLERGMITRALPAADTISFSPPFVVTDDEIDTIVAVAREAVDQVAGELARETA
ncbi:aminotransferase [Conexibacter sp. JD483]|uniref:aminotransferase n=1 Tax=unclassified Conexibacter TaxID=2627773 RepID=UPI002722AE33|nr:MULTISPECIES: aminotransferase [unclassified Conexibacter]MDO8185277.1 aminotransferase [Conexibacter sp. CPCC 205706]MDO8198323.1 aminotransferase [Conexibacter sp. CPCC 205762]MDR9367716.1 aminotransferase [Conexibacter sp. JD483]